MEALANQDDDSERRYMILRDEDEEDCNQERDSEKGPVTSASCRQLCTFISLALALIMDNASYYMKEPFFPVVVIFFVALLLTFGWITANYARTWRTKVFIRHLMCIHESNFLKELTTRKCITYDIIITVRAKQYNVTETEIGVIFGSHFLVALVFSPAVGKFLPVIGTRFTFLFGLSIGVVTDITFIVIKQCNTRHAFFLAALTNECVAAIGSAATDTAALAIVAQVFPANVAKMIGMVETFSGIACLVGQPVGGLLYEFGGYELPFLAFGAITFLCLVVNFIILPSIEKTSSSCGSIRKLLLIPDVYPICVFIFIVAFCDGFLQPILALRADELGLSAAFVGVLFLLQGIVYTIFASMCGWLADANGSNLNKPMALIGILIICVSFLVMGPSPIFSTIRKDVQIPVLAVGLSVMGVGLAMTYVPTYPELISAAFDSGMLNDLQTQGVAAGLSMAIFFCGSCIGPIAGSSAYQLLGFACSTSIISAMCLFLALAVSIFYIGRTFPKT